MSDELKVWCQELKVDGVTEVEQRRSLLDEEYENGWLRKQTVSTQQINELFNKLTSYAKSVKCAPDLFYTGNGNTIPDIALEMNGQSITQEDYPILFEFYGSTLPDMTPDTPSGFTYAVRKQ